MSRVVVRVGLDAAVDDAAKGTEVVGCVGAAGHPRRDLGGQSGLLRPPERVRLRGGRGGEPRAGCVAVGVAVGPDDALSGANTVGQVGPRGCRGVAHDGLVLLGELVGAGLGLRDDPAAVLLVEHVHAQGVKVRVREGCQVHLLLLSGELVESAPRHGGLCAGVRVTYFDDLSGHEVG